MFTDSRMVFLYAETSFHPGSGDSIVGVDLPIQRERHTNYPKNQGGGVKGAIRNLAREKGLPKAELDEIFGPEDASHQGAVSLMEARILLFPVKSLKGVFAWITCPFVIERFKRDIKRMNPNFLSLNDIKIFSVPSDKVFVTNPCLVSTSKNQTVLEDLSFDADRSKNTEVNMLAEWLGNYALRNTDDSYDYWRNKLRDSLVIISDEAFRDFVVNYTEVSTRHKRSETGTVEAGALWNEETLSSETLMYSGLLASRSNKKGSTLSGTEIIERVEKILNESCFIQMGASETVGQGFLGIRCYEPSNAANSENGQTEEEDKSSQINSKWEEE